MQIYDGVCYTNSASNQRRSIAVVNFYLIIFPLGFLVALIFCYCNGEVVSLLTRSWKRFKDQYLGGGGERGSSTRNRRHGSLGRSVVSTHVYSSGTGRNLLKIKCTLFTFLFFANFP